MSSLRSPHAAISSHPWLIKRLVFLLALFICVPYAAHADDASHLAKAQEMVNLLHLDRVLTQVIDSVIKQTTQMGQQMFGPGAPPPEKKAALDDLQKKLIAIMTPQVGWKAIEPDYIKLYASTYTDEELDAILVFYKSPAGKAMIEHAPGLTQQSNQLLQGKMATLQPQMRQMVEEFIKTQGPQALPAAPATSMPPPPASGTPH